MLVFFKCKKKMVFTTLSGAAFVWWELKDLVDSPCVYTSHGRERGSLLGPQQTTSKLHRPPLSVQMSFQTPLENHCVHNITKGSMRWCPCALEEMCRKGFPTTRSLMDCLKGISEITIYQEMWRCVTRRFIISLPLVTWKAMKWGNCEGLRNTA